uniref:Secreted protein n=1 Tax=Romanomermis culicivorax TaxID=13658 RepID=A0A915KBS2_ROMCU
MKFVNGLTSLAFLRCPIANCTCSVTQWSDWSSCKELMCTNKPGNRTRSRKVIEFCRRNYLHERLSESESCALPRGCDQLRKIHETNDTLVMND